MPLRHLLLATSGLLVAGLAAADEPGATLAFRVPFEVDTFAPGAVLYTNRSYGIAECPDSLKGLKFARTSIDWAVFEVTQPGWLTLLTPDPAHPRAASQWRALEGMGFQRVESPLTFQLFGAQPFDQVRTYRKQVAAGERFRLRKWVVAVGFADAVMAAQADKPWAENEGELLYNGIRLPADWPPETIQPSDDAPMPVPYLDHPPAVIPIDVGRQLFVDDFLIESTNLARRFGAVTKYEGNPVLKPETALELHGELNDAACPKSGGVWWDLELGRFRMWYEAGWIHTICYATSADGLHWERPELDIEPGTNRILPAEYRPDSWSVVPDPATADPAQRWKIYLRPPGGTMPGLSFVSADGIHWSTPLESGPTGDRSTMFYNPFRRKWVFSLRDGWRARSRSYWESDDFLAGSAWQAADPVFWAAADRDDPPDPEIGRAPQLYNLDAVAYESLMLGLFEIHRGPENDVCAQLGLPKITELELAYSRDGFHWSRPDRRPLIRAERRDVWDRGYVQSVGGICCVRGDQLWFYYSGFQGDATRLDPSWMKNGMYDRGATGVAFLRRDGFAAMATAGEGTLTTRPVTFRGAHLFVNVDAADGELRVEVVDDDGQPVAPFTLGNCEPLRVDDTTAAVRWRGGELSTLAGTPVRFRFSLRRGSLYAFWVSRDETGRSDGYVAAGGPGFTGPTDTVGRAALTADRRTRQD